MEFFVENWIWFLVAGVVILMTLIGYIAEKTDFGRKDIPKKEKVKKEKVKKEDVIEQIEVEPENKPEVQISLATDAFLDDDSENDFEIETDSEIEFEAENDLETEIEVETDVESDFEAESEPELENYEAEEVPEELTVPFGDVTFDEPIESMTDVLENTEEPEMFVSEVVNEEPVEELNLEDVASPDIELPDLDSIVSKDSSDEDDDDDVWKF